MKIDTRGSAYQESSTAVDDFDGSEIRYLRQLLRMLHYREYQVKSGEVTDSGSLLFIEMERDSIAWVLSEVGFL